VKEFNQKDRSNMTKAFKDFMDNRQTLDPRDLTSVDRYLPLFNSHAHFLENIPYNFK
jgi:hypothetical protein